MRPSLDVWRGAQRIGALLEAGMEEGGWSKLQHVRKYVVQQCRRYRKLV